VKEKPDLIVHVGDFHYREQCSKGKLCEKLGKAVGYGWTPWKLDFIEPSAAAFAIAPWVMSRGNHEDCQRAFRGYQMLIPNEKLPATGCSPNEATSYLRWGDLLLVNVDSSSISEMPETTGDALKEWRARWQEIDGRIQAEKKTGAKHIWLVTHKPVFGLAMLAKQYVPVNINLASSFADQPAAQDIELLLAGHVHNSHIVAKKNYPLQLVVGNSGTMLDEFATPVTEENRQTLAYDQIRVVSNDFGYAILTRKVAASGGADDWQIQFKNSRGELTADCLLGQKGQSCFQAAAKHGD